ncbi:unnamed protein product [Brassicogethes aeneus]|uniref:Uncharacterized protein n=1 Tax=Brassicogethes aeneus TaxID=1431903 RepID=A0A9P0FE07_BRAAE|nr:unnamed protein product [Brassicogethes aeneus]
MVYESDFYTTRRYRTSPSVSSYTSSKREIPWEKVPFVPRPSLVPDPITAFGKRKPDRPEPKRSILHPAEREKILPQAGILLEPPKPYVSARDQTREKVFESIRRQESHREESMDTLLPRLHRVAECPDLPYKRRLVQGSDLPPVW